ncbi:dnaJ homolog subfamily C member 3-like [Haliotis asinina]|uniref:dnaJ homolog subfamily C member 3-like n=1 Tax=Haliotis asinina TaxID=109174 RepID=UPI00353230F8
MTGLTQPIQIFHSVSLFIFTLDLLRDGVEGSSSEVEDHLEMGKKLLAAGQLADALSHYHAAVEGDPGNYLTYFRRATVYLALGKSRSALPDLDKVIQLRPDFTGARLQRANVFLKQGKLEDALDDYESVAEKDPNNEDALRQIELIQPLEEDIQQAKEFYKHANFKEAIDLLTRAIEICPWDPELREIRAECYIAEGDLFKATGDIRPTTKLRPDNTKGYLKLSMLYYNMGESDESLTQIRECLKLDPDHKECFSHYKKVKKLVKQIESAQTYSNEEKFDDCIDKAKAMLKTEPNVHPYVLRAHSHLCHCHSKAGHLSDALMICEEVLELDPQNIEALADRAEAHILNEDFQAAINDYQEAANIDENNRRVQDGLNKAQKMLKQSQKRDYYKILGVKRTARKKDILKAYRKLAMVWHPDKYPEGDERKKAEKKFIDLAAAKEVLTDPEKRQRFDNGEDPLDPEEQQQHQGHPFFHQGFNPFGGGGGGGGYSFKFHFN